MNEQAPLPIRVAARAEAECVVRAIDLLMRRRIRRPRVHVGMRVRFADGTSAPVYRETVVDGEAPDDPCVLVVKFRLIGVHGRGHRAFRAESLLNTPLFVGFPGFVSKLWLAHDENDIYRGMYEWDGAERAAYYARSLWRVLAPVSARSSIGYTVAPRLRRDDVLRNPLLLSKAGSPQLPEWARPVEVA